MSRGSVLIGLLVLFLPPFAAAQEPPSAGGWTPPRTHVEAMARGRRDLALLDAVLDGARDDTWFRLQRIRIVYFLGLEEEEFLERLDRETTLLAQDRPEPDEGLQVVLAGYRAAGEVLRGKHALWPGNKMRHLRAGLAVLDSLVHAHPEHLELRYLRLISTAYLPFLFGRRDGVREDARILAGLLPAARSSLPGPTLVAMTDVLLEAGRLEPEVRGRIEALRSAVLAETPSDPFQALSPPSSERRERSEEQNPETPGIPDVGG